MNIRNAILVLLSIGIIILNFIYGNAISWTLSVAIVASIAYYFFQLSVERLILAKLPKGNMTNETKAKAAQVASKYRKLISFGLLTVVFLSSIFTIRRVMMPRDASPYFYNNDYHAISNSGIAFDHSITLTKQSIDNDQGSFTLQRQGQQAKITCRNFYEPIFAFQEEDKPYKVINNIFPKKITNNFTIENDRTRLAVSVSEQSNWFKKLIGIKPKNIYQVTISNLDAALSSDENISYKVQDQFSFSSDYLVRGMSLYNIFYRQSIIDAPKHDGLQIAQELLHLIGNSYLLKSQDADGGYYFFPDKAFVDNGFRLSIDNQVVTPQFNTTATIALDQKFYAGFNNRREIMMVRSLASGAYQIDKEKAALIFDHPPSYWLSNRDEESFLHNVSTRFLTNDYDAVIDGKSNEGFYFNNFGLQSPHSFNARLQYITEKPTDSFRVSIQDFRAGVKNKVHPTQFSLQTDDAGVQYLFDIRDFSDNGFSFGKVLLYASILYLGFLLVLLFFPGKNLGRIEPIIFVVIYMLSIIRMMMYWRVATFPPLDNISKYELENTMINFDFNLGIKLPIPLTVIWVLLFLVLLIVYRTMGTRIKAFIDSITDRYIVTSRRSIFQSYGLLMLGLLVIYLINSKILHIEVLTRILSIIVPLILYIIFSIISNKRFAFDQKWVSTRDARWLTEVKAYFHYLMTNPTFYLSAITLAYFAMTDRGFAIVFFLFLILKNILLNFLKRSYNSSERTIWQMLSKPNNYWIYALSAMVVYFVILSVKSLFYYVLQYYLVVIGVVIAIVLIFLFLFYKEKKKWIKGVAIALGVFMVLAAIPFTRNIIDGFVHEQIKHTQYRVSIIHQPISDLLLENEYSSFSTRKIIETAENQWFINSYISKEFDNEHTLNLRPYNRVGVDYNTQTRDVVLPRFVISEMGNFVMYLLLILIALPLIIYLMSYRFTNEDNQQYKINPKSYPGLIPLIFLFTIALFVWLTATNRFVFFGQDFPFLSLTSKTSVVLPLLLFGITLCSEPKSFASSKIVVQKQLSKYALFLGMIAFFALITVQRNVLSSRNFSVVVAKTQETINSDFNGILDAVQDSISVRNPRYTFTQMMAATKTYPAFQEMMSDRVSDPYTRSIIERVVRNPYSANMINSPIYLQYDGYRYRAAYNQHFYLELPPVDPAKVWHGSIAERSTGHSREATINIDGTQEVVQLPYFSDRKDKNIRIAILPQSWLANANGNLAIIDVNKDLSPTTKLSIYKDMNNSYEQKSTSYAMSINSKDMVAIEQGDRRSTLTYSDNAHLFAINKWINGSYRILYPHRPKNLWIYHFAHNIKALYDDDDNYRSRFDISLDYNFNKASEEKIHQTYGSQKLSNKFKFAVITADGDGHIRLMQDFVTNRKAIDPNEHYKIYQMQQQQYFFSNIRNERDQWGEANLLNMQLGPGSAIKPLVAALIASQVNAGWEHLYLSMPSNPVPIYAGFKMIKPWKNSDHGASEFSLPSYIQYSSNFYQSLIIFLGSYPKESFMKNGKASLAHVLSTTAGKNNATPILRYGEGRYYLPSYNGNRDKWPKTDYGAKKNVTYFGNENSLLANGFEINANTMTKDKNKDAAQRGVFDRINIIDSANFAKLHQQDNSSYLWSMPEESSYFQYLRAYKDMHQNFSVGLKSNTLGGYPYQLSSFKLLEAYNSLFTQNRSMRLHLDKRRLHITPWHIDSTWTSQTQFKSFLSQNIFKGMYDVIHGGTAGKLAYLKGKYASYYFYAKTGTINEEGSGNKSSRRLVVTITDKDMQVPENIGNAKVYTLFFMIDRNQDFYWPLVQSLIEDAIASQSFKAYFGR